MRGIRAGDKRKRQARGDSSDVGAYGTDDGYKGPWSKFADELEVAKPTEEEIEKMGEWAVAPSDADGGAEDGDAAKKKKAKGKTDGERSTLHVPAADYIGRTYMQPPKDLGVPLGKTPAKCFLPKKAIHTFSGHTKGVSKTIFFPQTGHLLLSCSMDSKIKLWEFYGKRRLLRTFHGHTQAVRDIAFNNDGSRFISAGYDKMVRLWDTETGECLNRFTNKKIPYCCKFHPAEDKQHLIVVGTSDKHILCFDINTGEIVQDYDRHLGAVNSITFVDNGKRMVTTSDDKSIRVWEWDIPVDIKYIADPTMHSMPCVNKHPGGKFLVIQSMDNQVLTFAAGDKFRQNKKKTFKGHMSAGYACQVGVSPDGNYVISGDGNGYLVIWDWKSGKRYAKLKSHDNVCIGVDWHPFETSKVVTCGWDGIIKLYD